MQGGILPLKRSRYFIPQTFLCIMCTSAWPSVGRVDTVGNLPALSIRVVWCGRNGLRSLFIYLLRFIILFLCNRAILRSSSYTNEIKTHDDTMEAQLTLDPLGGGDKGPPVVFR